MKTGLKKKEKFTRIYFNESGSTVDIFTHNSALKAMADRVILIKNGQAVSQEINEHPEPIENIEW